MKVWEVFTRDDRTFTIRADEVLLNDGVLGFQVTGNPSVVGLFAAGYWQRCLPIDEEPSG